MQTDIQNIINKDEPLTKKRKAKDFVARAITFISSTFGFIILGTLLFFIFSNGIKLLKPELIVSDYHAQTYTVKTNEEEVYHLGGFVDPKLKDSYFSPEWGISVTTKENKEGGIDVIINHIDNYSPIKQLTQSATGEKDLIKVGQAIESITMVDSDDEYVLASARDGADGVIEAFNRGVSVLEFQTSTGGGGIRGSLLTTLLLILLTLVIALPIGIISAIYLHEYAPQNKFTDIIRSLIDMTNGIPSIIFGFIGVIVFIPIMNGVVGSQGGSIASGALTLTIILLPTIIKTTEESLKTIPLSYRQASLALGASQTQTVFKVVLPNAVGGLLTATLLSIGRIIGESAALIYAIGTVIKDTVAINERSTSLAVHIWSIMAGENPNFELASSIAIIILVVVFILNITVKIISKRMDKTQVRVIKEKKNGKAKLRNANN
ncbi:MAG: phosphate ABC transporter permease PstA [Acholeplasmataceae bacterium]|jgi:phosphate transport system permease protein